MNRHSYEYRQGLASRDAGESFSANPFQAGTRECSDWFKGWEAADDLWAEMEREEMAERDADGVRPSAERKHITSFNCWCEPGFNAANGGQQHKDARGVRPSEQPRKDQA